MANPVELVVRLVDQASAGLSRLQGNFKSFFAGVGSGTKALGAAFSAVTGALSGLGIVTTLGDVEEVIKKFFDFLGEGIQRSAAADLAFAQLDASLNRLGLGGNEAAAGLEKYAKQLSDNSTIEASEILRLEALGIQMGRTPDQVKKLTDASVKLAESGVLPLDAAFRTLARTFSGQAAGLTRIGVNLSDLTKAQLESGAAVDRVAANFGAGAAAKLDTYAGSVQNLAKSWDQFKEGLGSFVTQNPEVVAALQAVSSILQALTIESEHTGRLKSLEDQRAELLKQIQDLQTLQKSQQEIADRWKNIGLNVDDVTMAVTGLLNIPVGGPGSSAALDWLLGRGDNTPLQTASQVSILQIKLHDLEQQIARLSQKPAPPPIAPHFSTDVAKATDEVTKLVQQIQLLQTPEGLREEVKINFDASQAIQQLRDQIRQVTLKETTPTFSEADRAKTLASLREQIALQEDLRNALVTEANRKRAKVEVDFQQDLDNQLLDATHQGLALELAQIDQHIADIKQRAADAHITLGPEQTKEIDDLSDALKRNAVNADEAKNKMVGFAGILGETFAQAAGTAISQFTDAIDQIATSTDNAGTALRNFATETLRLFAKMIEQALVLAAIQAGIAALTGGTGDVQASGFAAILRQIANLPFHAAGGGITTGPRLIFAGDNPSGVEAIVPLEKAGQMGFGGGPNINVSVNLGSGGIGRVDTDARGSGRQLGQAIAAAVHREILEQQRPGGLLTRRVA